jgi:hypothetical protein
MDSPTPTSIALYANNTGSPRRVAVFHWSEGDGVTLETIDPEWSRLATTFFERGVDLPQEQRMVLPAEGPVFMKALLQPFRMSYYTLQDETQR